MTCKTTRVLLFKVHMLSLWIYLQKVVGHIFMTELELSLFKSKLLCSLQNVQAEAYSYIRFEGW